MRDDKKGGLKIRRIYRENERAKERWKDCVVEMAREETEIKKDGIDRENGINGGRYVFVRGQRRGSERELFRPSLSLVHAGLSEYCVPLASIVWLIYVC